MNRILLNGLCISILAITSSFLTACDTKQSEEKIKQYADIQTQAGAANQVSAEKQYLEQKSQTMETDLVKRQRFYQAVSGTFEGTIRVGEMDYNIRLTIVPSLPRYVPDGRVRTPEEVASDLENLYLKVQVVQWNPQNNLGAVGCLIDQVRPDIVKGRVDVVSTSCPNLYSIRPARAGSTADRVSAPDAASLALDLVDGRVDSVDKISGKMQPTSNANVYFFTATRVQE